MSPSRTANQNWLIGELAASFVSVIEAVAGERLSVQCEVVAQVPAPVDESPGWHQPFRGVAGAVWLRATARDRHALGGYLLRAADMGEDDGEPRRSTYLEAAGQALSGLAQALSGRLEREVTLSAGVASLALPEDIVWVAMRFEPGGTAVTIYAGFEAALLENLSPGSATLDLLLDVELPVSVSLGRAQVPLKDVLKLTTGSLVELNRSIVDPVEVIVNNCVIARGEVVVVEGNFGVRIQQVVSRQERLRTLPAHER